MKKLIVLIVVLTAFNTFYSFKTRMEFDERLDKIYNHIGLKESVVVTATMYNALEGQCDSDPLITAGMYKINPNKASEHKWIAMSRNMLKRWGGSFQYGDKVLISGAGHKDGIYIVADTMNKRFINRIDILETIGTPLYKFENVKIQKINS